jgi:hypothetical protein
LMLNVPRNVCPWNTVVTNIFVVMLY